MYCACVTNNITKQIHSKIIDVGAQAKLPIQIGDDLQVVALGNLDKGFCCVRFVFFIVDTANFVPTPLHFACIGPLPVSCRFQMQKDVARVRRIG